MPDDGKGNAIISKFIATCRSIISVSISFTDLKPLFIVTRNIRTALPLTQPVCAASAL